MGEIDELNSCIGIVLAREVPESIRRDLLAIQHVLFDIGGELSLPGKTFIKEEDVEILESRLKAYNQELPPLKEFILPGGTDSAAFCHLARAVCRRAERWLVTLCDGKADVNPISLVYLNRLSDFLFVVARTLAREHDGAGEICWDRTRRD